jgi:hypothetical protein
MNLTTPQLTTILAALRLFQDTISDEGPDAVTHMAHFEDGTPPLTVPEIDALCQSLNFGDLPDHWTPSDQFTPDPDQACYIVFTDQGSMGEAYLEDDQWWWPRDPSGPITELVTHIHPLPNPPEDGNSDTPTAPIKGTPSSLDVQSSTSDVQRSHLPADFPLTLQEETLGDACRHSVTANCAYKNLKRCKQV